MRLTFTIPVRANFTLNSREHWRTRAKKRKAERNAVALMFRQAVWTADDRMGAHSNGYAVITLTRIGPRKLDSDNVQGALKAIRDEVAAQLGVDDGDERLTWNYTQEKGDYAVRVVIETREAVAA